MPVNVTGVKQLQKAMKDVEPALNKQMSQDIKKIMLTVRDKARGYLPAQNEVLSGWGKGTASAETIKGIYRAFPAYDYALARSKVQYSAGQNKRNRSGYRAAFYVYNNSAPGAIFETAGRRNQPKGEGSLNPNAPKQFNAAAEMLSNMRGYDKQKGRVIYRAWDETKNKVIPEVIKAINTVATDFNNKTQLNKAA
jgi:hypothetical protein